VTLAGDVGGTGRESAYMGGPTSGAASGTSGAADVPSQATARSAGAPSSGIAAPGGGGGGRGRGGGVAGGGRGRGGCAGGTKDKFSKKGRGKGARGNLGPDGLVSGAIIRSNKPVYNYGNYDPYYAQRFDRSANVDRRIETLLRLWGNNIFSGKVVLDIGCNSGFVSFLVAALGAARVEGVDIDAKLISEALRHLRRLKSEGHQNVPTVSELSGAGSRFPRSLVHSRGIVPYLSKPLLRPSYSPVLMPAAEPTPVPAPAVSAAAGAAEGPQGGGGGGISAVLSATLASTEPASEAAAAAVAAAEPAVVAGTGPAASSSAAQPRGADDSGVDSGTGGGEGAGADARQGAPGNVAPADSATLSGSVRALSAEPSLHELFFGVAAPLLPPAAEGGDGQKAEERMSFPYNIEFRSENLLVSVIEERRNLRYDVVLCLKLTKWVHLNWGDEGLKVLFHKCFRLLRPGGLLVLEAQEWSSYSSNKHLTPHGKQNKGSLILKPDEFTTYLVHVVGFCQPESLGSCPPLKRPLLLFRRPGPGEPDPRGTGPAPTYGAGPSLAQLAPAPAVRDAVPAEPTALQLLAASDPSVAAALAMLTGTLGNVLEAPPPPLKRARTSPPR